MSGAPAFLPYGRHCIEEDDIAAVAVALRSDFLTTGPMVAHFEEVFCAATGAKHAVACNSGTAALHLAALALGLGPGDAAIVPTITFVATANVIRMTGAEVVFADVDPETGLLTPAAFDEAADKAKRLELKFKAAFPVHLNGQVCDMAGLAQIAEKRGIALVEDACHALGVQSVGATRFSQIACFSTHPVKAIATGEGGVATTAAEDLAHAMRKLRSHGLEREAARMQDRDAILQDGEVPPWYYEMSDIGWNYRMPDVLCALGCSQIRKLDRFHRRRAELAAMYDDLLAPLAPRLVPAAHGARPHGWHLYVVLIDFDSIGIGRSKLMQELRARGIGSQVHYIPVHSQPYYRRRYGAENYPGAEKYYRRCLSLPLFPAMQDDDLRRVVAMLSELLH